jgi:hypothetical protein
MPATRSGDVPADEASGAKRIRRNTRTPARSTEQPEVAVVIPAVPLEPSRPAPQAAGDASQPLPSSSTSSSYAQAARGRKRPVGALPSSPRPDLVRGEPVFEHPEFKSMERPAPISPSPNLLYLDLRASELTAQEALEEAFPLVGNKAVGFEYYAAQRAVALAFASADTRAPFVDKPVGDTGLSFYVAPPERHILRRFTLSDVPLYDTGTILANLQQAFEPYGELVFLAPMLMTKTNWRSTTWHATLRVTKEQAAHDPPPVLDLLDAHIIVDIPNVRRFCRHCQDTNHTKSSCRQGQRQRRLAAERAAMNVDPVPQDRARHPPVTTTHQTTQEGQSPPPQQQQPPLHQQHQAPPQPQQDGMMDYTPSHQTYVDQLIQDTELPDRSTADNHHHYSTTTAHDAARDHGSAFNQ